MTLTARMINLALPNLSSEKLVYVFLPNFFYFLAANCFFTHFCCDFYVLEETFFFTFLTKLFFYVFWWNFFFDETFFVYGLDKTPFFLRFRRNFSFFTFLTKLLGFFISETGGGKLTIKSLTRTLHCSKMKHAYLQI